jgi:hypothetical protein
MEQKGTITEGSETASEKSDPDPDPNPKKNHSGSTTLIANIYGLEYLYRKSSSLVSEIR